MTIWKFKLSNETIISLPKDAIVLHLGNQGVWTCLWIMLDTKAPRVDRTFKFLSTGAPIPERYMYLRSIQRDDEIWHLFEIL